MPNPRKRIDEKGRYCPLPGTTVVSAIQRTDITFWRTVYNQLKNSPTICHYYTLLPLESYHMTTIALNTIDEVPSEDDWIKFINEKIPLFRELHTALSKQQIAPQISYVTVEQTTKIIMLTVSIGQKQVHAIQKLAEEYGCEDGLQQMNFHITLAYQKNTLHEDGDYDKIDVELDLLRDIFKKKQHIRLEPSKLCYFNDMTRFIPWDGTTNPFITPPSLPSEFYKEQIMIHSSIMHHFKTFSPFLWWKLLLDIEHQASGGPLCFEKTEPEYLKSMFQGLNFVLGSIDSKLNLSYLEDLHAHTMSHTQNQHDVDIENEDLKKQLQQTIDIYNTSIKTAISEKEKLVAIAMCVQALALIHPYCNDNGRAPLLLLLLKLLIQNDLSPAILPDLNHFNDFSSDNLLSAQKKFQVNCIIDESPPSGVILYLENNIYLTEVVAMQLARSMALWYSLDSKNKNTCCDIIQEVLKSKKSFTHLELKLLIESVEECLETAKASHNPVTVDLNLFRSNLQKKYLVQSSEPSLFSFVYNSVFGFFLGQMQMPQSSTTNKQQQHISTP